MEWSSVVVALIAASGAFAGVVWTARGQRLIAIDQKEVAERQREIAAEQLQIARDALTAQQRQDELAQQLIARDRLRDPVIRRGDIVHQLSGLLEALHIDSARVQRLPLAPHPGPPPTTPDVKPGEAHSERSAERVAASSAAYAARLAERASVYDVRIAILKALDIDGTIGLTSRIALDDGLSGVAENIFEARLKIADAAIAESEGAKSALLGEASEKMVLINLSLFPTGSSQEDTK